MRPRSCRAAVCAWPYGSRSGMGAEAFFRIMVAFLLSRQRYLLLGLQAAAEAGDTALAAHLINCLSRLSNHLGRTDDALEMVQLAWYGSRHLPSGRLKAVLAALEARTLALTGDLSGFRRAAGAALRTCTNADAPCSRGVRRRDQRRTAPPAARASAEGWRRACPPRHLLPAASATVRSRSLPGAAATGAGW